MDSGTEVDLDGNAELGLVKVVTTCVAEVLLGTLRRDTRGWIGDAIDIGKFARVSVGELP